MDRLRRRAPGAPRGSRGSAPVDEEHLHAWSGERRGVEGFVEPQTTTQPVTLLLVATDGEWTRRRVPSVRWAHEFCNRLGIPSYDAAVVGVPDRMREWNRRQSGKKPGNNFY